MAITRIPYRYPGKTALHSQNAPRLRTIPISVSPLEIYVPPLHRAPQTKFHSIPVKSLCMILLFLRHGHIGLCSARKGLYRIGISLYMIYDSISSVFRACICKQSVINFCLNGQSCSRARSLQSLPFCQRGIFSQPFCLTALQSDAKKSGKRNRKVFRRL